jgi:hypothetical protein
MRPTLYQALRDLDQGWVISPHMARIKTRHDHAPLAHPVLALGTEYAGLQAHFLPDFAQSGGTAKRTGSIA